MEHNGVLNGIDVLVRDRFGQIAGQRIGLITNHTGLTVDGKPTVDALHGAAEVKLAALFGPEHGIRGEFDAPIKDATDQKTRLPVYSLYGETVRPKPEQLAGLDALVYDIQDVGCRFYTYISTLGYALQAAAEHKLHMVVLDRPNPITGSAVEGPLADPERLSFTAWHPLPVRHGMTVGELARLYNVERKIGAGLIVVSCEGWRRSDWFDATGLTWTNPSPNMRCLTEATLYPGIGLLEFTNVSVGRGTDTPFEVIGAPWIDGRKLAAHMNARELPGTRFIPVRFTPRSSTHRDIPCQGINLLIVDRARFQCLRTGIEVAIALRDLFPDAWKMERYQRLLASPEVFDAFTDGAGYADLSALWRAELGRFARVRHEYLLYA